MSMELAALLLSGVSLGVTGFLVHRSIPTRIARDLANTRRELADVATAQVDAQAERAAWGKRLSAILEEIEQEAATVERTRRKARAAQTRAENAQAAEQTGAPTDPALAAELAHFGQFHRLGGQR